MPPHSIINSGQMGLGIGGREADTDTTYFQKAALGLLRGTRGPPDLSSSGTPGPGRGSFFQLESLGGTRAHSEGSRTLAWRHLLTSSSTMPSPSSLQNQNQSSGACFLGGCSKLAHAHILTHAQLRLAGPEVSQTGCQSCLC